MSKKKTTSKKDNKISFWGEFGMMSILGTVGLIALVIACFAF